jgi:hypothetical protein
MGGWHSAARRQGRCASLRDGLRPPLTPSSTEQIGWSSGRRQDPGRVTNRGTHAVESTRVNHNHRPPDYCSDKALCSIAGELMRFQRVGGSIPSRRTFLLVRGTLGVEVMPLAHTLATVITPNTDRSGRSPAHCSGIPSPELIPPTPLARLWAGRADRDKDQLVVVRIRRCSRRRSITYLRPVLNRIKEALDAAVADDRLASAASTVSRSFAWPQPTGIGDLDDLGNQC